MSSTTTRSAWRRLGVFAALGTLVAGAVAIPAFAASNPNQNIDLRCEHQFGEVEDPVTVTFSISGPDETAANGATPMTMDQVESTLPAEVSGVAVNSYEDIRTSVTTYGGNVNGASITKAGSVDASVEVSGNTVTLVIPGPIDGGSTIQTPEVTIDTTTTANSGGNTGLEPASPFYKLVANTDAVGKVRTNCEPWDDTARANATLTIAVGEETTTTTTTTQPEKDETPPDIDIVTPFDGAVYAYQADVSAAYSCSDPNLDTCEGTVPNGEPIDTETPGPKNFTVDASDTSGNEASETVTYVVLAEGEDAPPPPAYTSMTPARLLDTRDGESTIDGDAVGGGPIAGGEQVQLQVAGRADIPEDARAAVLNVTAASTEGAGYVTVYPCDGERPTASNLNFTAAGDTRPNAVVTSLDDKGQACLYVHGGPTHLVADAVGFFPVGAKYLSLDPGRLHDTRSDGSTVDGEGSGGGRVGPGDEIAVQVAGRHGVPANVDAAVLNITSVGNDGPGFVTAYPCDAERPVASNLNFFAVGEVVPNAAISEVGDDGTVCLSVGQTTTDLVVDISGYFPTGSDYVPFAPQRFADTRGEATFDGDGQEPLAGAGETHTVQVAPRGNVDDGARAAVLNVTAADTAGAGFVTVWPCDDDQPKASSLNYITEGQFRPNLVVTDLAADGTVCLVAEPAAAELIVDVAGFFPAPPETTQPPETTTTTTTQPPETTTTTTTTPDSTTVPGSTTAPTTAPPPTTEPPEEEAPLACAAFLSQELAQDAYDNLIDLALSTPPPLNQTFILAAAQLDPNGNGVACEDYPYLL